MQLGPINLPGRNSGIDVLRGIAIFMVMLLHFSLTYRLWNSGPLVGLLGQGWTHAILAHGNFAVTMFFVVSGFLITTNAAERMGGLGKIELRSFYIKRFARLIPCLLLALVIITILGLCSVASFATKAPNSRSELLLGCLSVLLFFHNILMQHLGYFDYALNVYWSLSVEEVFYLAFPIVCLILKRDALIAIPCVVLVMVAPFYRSAHENNEIYYLYANLACFDAIAIGCLTSILARRWRPSFSTARALQFGGCVTLVAFWLQGFSGFHAVFSFTIIALSTAVIILGSLTNPPDVNSRSAIGQAICWLGRHSYELYLFHIIVLGIMRDILPGKSLGGVWQIPWLLLFLLVSMFAAAGAARLIGDPANAILRRHFAPAP
ncbi:acyltransferase family protein [Acidisoma silvae]|uniref:Acyltransferase n=1 Tax=Acidisoma silvae TaxID=2802396 RepID=A0A963YW64_9PROT|nr:acyltransferase [Acidisoma silvae]MCB8877974.1 acyltransferase [Acidisoma silvae]